MTRDEKNRVIAEAFLAWIERKAKEVANV